LNALSALPANVGAIGDEQLDFLLSQFAANQPLMTRLLAADAMVRVRLNDAQLKSVTKSFKSAGPMELERLLGAFDRRSEAAIGSALIEALKDAKAVKSLSAEALRKHVAKYPEDVKKQAEELIASLNPDSSKQKAH